jgi:lipopolysaccharide transport system ATP-binding protein
MADQTEPLIRLESIGKCYRIFRNPQDRFKQALLNRFHGIARRQALRPLYREHWALRNVDFEMHSGEAVGIIGRNGAGKSTLLQIIAGTLAPTEGQVYTSGRITALLELGSGFNPEFVGRENVLLNAQILGLSREEALARFDDIASFADIGDFIDQPVKTYSSGMMMRLAFAVQTAFDPRILIVDEALSVGDMFFQAKCMARINKLVDSGVALLFVSHDVSVIRQICRRAVLLENGRVKAVGSARLVTDEYVKLQLEDRNQSAKEKLELEKLRLSRESVAASSPVLSSEVGYGTDNYPQSEALLPDEIQFGRDAFRIKAQYNRMGNGNAEIINVQMLRDNTHSTEFEFDELVLIRIAIQCHRALSNLNMGLQIRTLQGVAVLFFDTRIQKEMSRHYRAGKVYIFDWKIRLPLLHGNYVVTCGLAHPPQMPGHDWEFVDVIPHAYEFRVAPRKEGMIDGFVTLPAELSIITDCIQ